jgi:hypothetical protein
MLILMRVEVIDAGQVAAAQFDYLGRSDHSKGSDAVVMVDGAVDAG